MSDDSELDDLVRAAQVGPEAALLRLLAAVRPLVYRWSLVQTGAPDDAEDITQQVLLRVQRGVSSFTFAARFTTWLYAVTRRTAADWRRTQQRRSTLLAARPPQAAHSEQPDIESSRLLELVRVHLGGLPARQRELFDLVDLQGVPPNEAADRLGLNHNTARVHVLRARRAIRARILAVHPDIVEELR
ncbi:MAG TPA: RNA polymerase sigma factor [Longimicrobiales bacterium]|nr:RNA polymerase sigma factor [Longimicrobiales bacterium]